jgi:hypothetical protein
MLGAARSSMKLPLLRALLLLLLVSCGAAAPASSSTEPAAGESAGPALAGPAGEPAATSEPSTSGSSAASGAEAPAPASKTAKCKPVEPPPGETDQQRQRRLKREKIEQCQLVATAIQKAQLQDTIASVNDKALLRKVAGQLTTAADELDQLAVCLEGLRKLRDEYSGRARSMASKLTAAIQTTEIEDQKAALAEFRKLHPKQVEFVGKINEYCNAPPE